MLIPTRLTLVLAALWFAATTAAALMSATDKLWLYAGALFAGVLLADAVLLRRMPVPSVRRQAPHSLAAGRWHPVEIVLTNPARRAISVHVHDHHPGAFAARNLPVRLAIPARGWAQFSYGVRSTRRGAFEFAPVQLRLRSQLGLLERQVRVGEPQPVRVYPDFGALSGYALLATDHRLSRMGILQRRRRGEGLEFHQLRDYRVGDSLRHIDAKATARMHRLIAREYQDERDQTIVVLLDCGRRMAAADGERTHFDAALDAVLLLAHVGLHHGDAVGALTMAGEHRFVAPRKARSSINLLLDVLYDLQPTLQTSDYHGAALDLMRRVRKRALVIVVSNLRDEDDDSLLPALQLMRRRHLVLFASLRERVLAQTLSAPVHDLDAALAHTATADYLQSREAVFGKLERAGAMLLDVEPQELPLALVNRYLDVKRAGLL